MGFAIGLKRQSRFWQRTGLGWCFSRWAGVLCLKTSPPKPYSASAGTTKLVLSILKKWLSKDLQICLFLVYQSATAAYFISRLNFSTVPTQHSMRSFLRSLNAEYLPPPRHGIRGRGSLARMGNKQFIWIISSKFPFPICVGSTLK